MDGAASSEVMIRGHRRMVNFAVGQRNSTGGVFEGSLRRVNEQSRNRAGICVQELHGFCSSMEEHAS